MTTAISTKRLGVLLLVVCLILSCFSGCGPKRSNKPTEPDNLPPQLVLDPADMTTEATEPTEAPTTEPTEETTEPTKETKPKGMPGVVAGDSVNIRFGPGTNYGSNSTLSTGTQVYIQDVDLKGTLPWGKTEEGWICLNYVQLDNPDDLLPYASSALGITMNSNAQLYNGPGTFYGKAGTIKKDVRLNIFGIVGNWARIAEGWLLVDHIYIDCTEGPEAPVMGTVTGSGVNIRSGPGTSYGAVTSVGKGTRLKIFYVVDYYGDKWGCGEAGWISMNYVLLDNDPAGAIVGTWCGHASQSADSSTSHIFTEWNFTAGGNYSCTQWIYDESMSGASDIKQSVSEKSGKYTFDGTKLTMDSKDVTYTLNNDKLTIDAGYGAKPHLKGTLDDAIKAFLKEKYPSGQPDDPSDDDESQTPVIDASIVGSWSAARAYNSADGVLCFTMGNSWTFNSDGTFQMSENSSFWIYNNDGTLGQYFESTATNSSGTFTFDGTTLVVTRSDGTKRTGTASVQNGVLVVNWGSGNESMYKGNANDLAATLFPGT